MLKKTNINKKNDKTNVDEVRPNFPKSDLEEQV